ncbi:hypothetical protein IQ264_25810 [Phormidium sp. LEGE 05292]|uniref:hypothetical protein n=1 Tax=[Phormidium] sp. LEGE 05292 TaxID=767427 RepID=UPI00187DDD8A|nr:hypothetical protein [Phormidium sp. LEGE 05292]MBE9228832.1 hypothetical protein [Phormidium sp. LEGE 05292]
MGVCAIPAYGTRKLAQMSAIVPFSNDPLPLSQIADFYRDAKTAGARSQLTELLAFNL